MVVVVVGGGREEEREKQRIPHYLAPIIMSGCSYSSLSNTMTF